jgi:hypothetical protein
MNNDVFEFSKEYCRLEKYKCYDDRSKDSWITGDELLKNENIWSKETKKRWHYFYRPYNYGFNIGREQKKIIIEKEEEIKKIEERREIKLFSLNLHRKILFYFNKIKFPFIVFIVFFNITLLIYLGFQISLIIFILLSITSLLIMRIKIQREKTSITYIKRKIKEINDENQELDNDIFVLEKEIQYLLSQHKKIKEKRLKGNQIEKRFWNDIKKIEVELIRDKLDKGIDEAITEGGVGNFYKGMESSGLNNNNVSYPNFPVIPSWAILQQSQHESIKGIEAMNLSIVSDDIKDNIATWREVSNNKPFFRVWYIQFFFFQEKNINIVSFYYDFITKKKYSEYLETYQYNHITNYSYISTNILKQARTRKNIPSGLFENIFSNEVDVLSFVSSSGSSMQCILPNKNISKGLSKWLKCKNESDNYNKEDSETFTENSNRKKLFNEIIESDELISNLARASLKKLKNKVEEFSISKDDWGN